MLERPRRIMLMFTSNRAEITPDLQAIQRITLDNASATRIADMAQRLMDARQERLRRTEPETAALQQVTCTCFVLSA